MPGYVPSIITVVQTCEIVQGSGLRDVFFSGGRQITAALFTGARTASYKVHGLCILFLAADRLTGRCRCVVGLVGLVGCWWG